MEKLLFENGAELFRIGDGVGESNFHEKLRCLGKKSRAVSSEANAAKQHYTGVTEVGFSGLRYVFEYHIYT
jgi:hypothetical protein